MGRVFTPESIAHDEIPRPGAHERAGTFVLGELFNKATSGYLDLQPEPPASPGLGLEGDISEWTDSEGRVEAAMVYGSTALGRASLRSDLDVLVTYRADDGETLRHIGSVFAEAERTFHVPVEKQLFEAFASSDPLIHNIDPLFMMHLRKVQAMEDPQWSINWPVVFMHTDDPIKSARLRRMGIRYAAMKAKLFAGTLTSRDAHDGRIDYSAFQRALELPGAIGRKGVPATNREGDPLPDTDDKYALQALARERLEVLVAESRAWFYPRANLAISQHDALLRRDAEYDAVLQETIEDPTKLREYDDWLHGNYLPSLRLARDVSMAWAACLEDYNSRVENSFIGPRLPPREIDYYSDEAY